MVAEKKGRWKEKKTQSTVKTAERKKNPTKKKRRNSILKKKIF